MLEQALLNALAKTRDEVYNGNEAILIDRLRDNLISELERLAEEDKNNHNQALNDAMGSAGQD